LSDFATYLFNHQLSDEHKPDRLRYGLFNIKKVKDLYNTIIDNPEQIITLTNTLDSPCNSDCKAQENSCSGKSLSLRDLEEIKAYGLKPGRVSSKKLIKKIKQFKLTHVINTDRPTHIESYSVWKKLHDLHL